MTRIHIGVVGPTVPALNSARQLYLDGEEVSSIEINGSITDLIIQDGENIWLEVDEAPKKEVKEEMIVTVDPPLKKKKNKNIN